MTTSRPSPRDILLLVVSLSLIAAAAILGR
jgi:hypothetical protein